MRLRIPSAEYSSRNEGERNRQIEAADRQNHKRNQDVHIGDGTLYLSSPNGTEYPVTVTNSAGLEVDGSAVGGGFTPIMAKRTSTSTGTAGPRLMVPWDVETDANTSVFTWSSGNSTRLTIAADGLYHIGAYLTYQSSTQRAQGNGEIYINGTLSGGFRGDTYIRNSGSSWDYGVIEIGATPFNLTSGDYVEIGLARTSGADSTYDTGGTGTLTLRGSSCEVWVTRFS